MGTAELTSATGLDGWTNGFNQRQQQWIELNGASPSPKVRPTASLTASWLADLVLCSSWSAEVTGGGVQQWLFNEQLAPFLAKCQLNANDDDGGQTVPNVGTVSRGIIIVIHFVRFHVPVLSLLNGGRRVSRDAAEMTNSLD